MHNEELRVSLLRQNISDQIGTFIFYPKHI